MMLYTDEFSIQAESFFARYRGFWGYLMKKAEDILLKVTGWFMAVLIFAMMVDVFAAVISRYVLKSSIPFAEELGRYIFVWITFTGMARCVATDKHVALDLLSHALHGGKKKAWELAINVISMVFFGFITWSGVMLCMVGAKQKSPTMRIPMQYMYVIIPICGILSLFFLIMKISRLLKKEEAAA